MSNGSWIAQIVYGAALMLCLSVVIAIFPAINRLAAAEVPWFPVPMLAVAFLAVMMCHRRSAQLFASAQRARSVRRQVCFGLLSVVVLTVVGLSLTGWSTVISGQSVLEGDNWDATLLFRNSYSIFLVFAEGLTEEASIRGVVQLPITGRLGSTNAQIVACMTFVALHAFTRSGVAEFAFLGLMGVICGLLASTFRSVWLPAIVHSTSNVLIAGVVLIFRSQGV
jgi:membrane protease YdiL (CAAX protease family)